MFKRLFTLMLCTIIMSCNLKFLIVKAEEKPELYNIPIISNEINQKFIVGYLYDNELFISVDDICRLTRSTCEISNQQVKIVQGIREIKIDLKQNKIKFGNQTTEFIVKRYNNKILVKPHAILNLLCANINYNKINNSLFILMPSITIYEAIQPKLYSKCYYDIYDNDEFNTIVRMSASCFSDLFFDGYGNFFNKIPDALSFHGADSYIDNALIEISKVDIYNYSIIEDSINNNLKKRTATIDSLKNISDYAENINSVSSVYTDILKDVIGNSDMFLSKLVKEMALTNNIVEWLSAAKSTEEKLNYNIDSFALIGKVLTQQNIGEIQNTDILIKRADFISNTLSSKVATYLNATEEQLKNKLYDITIKALAENINTANIGNSTSLNELSLFLMAFDVGANVTKALMKDEFQAWDSDINAIVISDIQNIMFDVIKQSYNINEAEGFSNYDHVEKLINSINLYNRITIAMFSNLKKSNDKFHMYEKSFSDTWDNLCQESAENSYNLYSCNLERNILPLDDFKENYNNDITELIDIESCEKYNDTLIVPIEDETQSTEFVEITEVPTEPTPQTSAIDLIDKSIPEIISLMNGEYQIIQTEMGGYYNGTYSGIFYIQNQSVFPGMEFYVETLLNESVDFKGGQSTGKEIQSNGLRKNLEAGKYALDVIQVNKSGKATESIFANMDYIECSKVLGNFDCIQGNGGYIGGSPLSALYTYNEKNAKIELHFIATSEMFNAFRLSENNKLSSEQMKSFNPSIMNVVIRKAETVTTNATEPPTESPTELPTEPQTEPTSELKIETGKLSDSDIKPEWQHVISLDFEYSIFKTDDKDLKEFLDTSVTNEILSYMATDSDYNLFISGGFEYDMSIDGYLSIDGWINNHPEGGQGYLGCENYTFFVDLKNRKVLSLNDLFSESEDLVYNEIREKADKYISDKRSYLMNPDALINYDYEKCKFLLTKDKLTLIFSPYEISVGAVGSVEIEIPVSDINLTCVVPEVETNGF